MCERRDSTYANISCLYIIALLGYCMASLTKIIKLVLSYLYNTLTSHSIVNDYVSGEFQVALVGLVSIWN